MFSLPAMIVVSLSVIISMPRDTKRRSDTMKSAPLSVVNSVRTTDLAFNQYRNAPLDDDTSQRAGTAAAVCTRNYTEIQQ